ncbi:hypothetical protein [Tissierella praeacuta]|uniref:hypothetical protein n=1 Tax=Tissierella praeacuta TaxID=43131 RepID=UPI003340A3AB
MKNVNYLDDDIKFSLKQLDSKMVKELIHELKLHGEFDLVDISTDDGAIVKISIH